MVQYSFSLENFEIFILILVRVSCFVYIAPFYGMSNVPNQVKIGLSAMIALLVSGFADVSQVEYTGLIGYAVIVLKEGITGLLDLLQTFVIPLFYLRVISLIWISVCQWQPNLIRSTTRR
jgi:flagellar biosynthesis protein FliR